MTRGMMWAAAAALTVSVTGGAAYAMLQGEGDAAALRATGQVGEQADGYMGVVGGRASEDIRRRVDAVNIQRRALYTQRASQRGTTVEEMAASTACQILATRVAPGQHYRLSDGIWRQRNGNEPVPLPSYCG